MATVADFSAAVNHGRHVRWDRVEQCTQLGDYKRLRIEGMSQRQAAAEVDAPRTTLEAWLALGQTLDAEPLVTTFFESTAGLAFLHRLTAALHTVMVELGACGIRLVCKLLKLTGLDRFVASSFEAQRRFNVSVQERIIQHAQSERTRLSASMPLRDITVAQDETFSGGLTLVAIEPESGFILLEEAAQARDCATWDAAMGRAMAGVSCNVIQSTSDEAKALIAYAENVLGAQHSPDLFHVQQEMSKAVSAPMAAKARAADRDIEKAAAAALATEAAAKAYQAALGTRGPGRPPNWLVHSHEAERAAHDAKAEVERIAAVRETLRENIKGLGEDYHLADLVTGERSSGGVVLTKLQRRLDEVRALAVAEGLAEHALARIAKAERVLPKMAATIDFVSRYIRGQVDQLDLTGPEAYLVHAKLIPACYLERVAAKGSKADGAALRDRAVELIFPLFAPGGAFASLDQAAREHLLAHADRLAGIFQRSSSCVEGRNGVLSFRHHGLRGLPPRKRQCLTALHNYFIERPDGSTAAERFFGAAPRSLFEAVLAGVSAPRRPRSPLRRQTQAG